MRILRRLTAAVVASLVVVGGAVPALAADVAIPDPGGGVVGLAYDDANARLYVLSEVDGTSIVVTDTAGEELGTISYAGSPTGAHALAFHDGQLYVGDVAGQRAEVTVFQMAPELGNVPYQAYDFAYPDGAHDAKSMVVSGKGRIYIITDGDNPGIYRAELDPSRQSVNPLTRATDAPAGVTDAVFLSDGATLVMRTAQGVQAVDAYSWETLATTTYIGAPPSESLTAFGADRLLVGDVLLRDEAVPTVDSTVTIAEPTPQPSVIATPEAPETPETSEPAAEVPPVTESAAAPPRRGTLIAIGAAAALALACGLLVLIRRS